MEVFTTVKSYCIVTIFCFVLKNKIEGKNKKEENVSMVTNIGRSWLVHWKKVNHWINLCNSHRWIDILQIKSEKLNHSNSILLQVNLNFLIFPS